MPESPFCPIYIPHSTARFPNSSKLLLSNKEPLFNATSVGNFLNRPEALGNHSKTVSFHKSSLYLHPLLDSIFMNTFLKSGSFLLIERKRYGLVSAPGVMSIKRIFGLLSYRSAILDKNRKA